MGSNTVMSNAGLAYRTGCLPIHHVHFQGHSSKQGTNSVCPCAMHLAISELLPRDCISQSITAITVAPLKETWQYSFEKRARCLLWLPEEEASLPWLPYLVKRKRLPDTAVHALWLKMTTLYNTLASATCYVCLVHCMKPGHFGLSPIDALHKIWTFK